MPFFKDTVFLIPREIFSTHFNVGIDNFRFQYDAFPEFSGRQRQQNWCWAACIQMLLNYHRISVTQEQIVERVYGKQFDAPATPTTIVAALNGWAIDKSFRDAFVLAEVHPANDSWLIVSELVAKNPLIVGFDGYPTGHACLLTSAWHRPKPGGGSTFYALELRDPWQGNPSRNQVLGREFADKAQFVVKVSVKKSLLSRFTFPLNLRKN